MKESIPEGCIIPCCKTMQEAEMLANRLLKKKIPSDDNAIPVLAAILYHFKRDITARELYEMEDPDIRAIVANTPEYTGDANWYDGFGHTTGLIRDMARRADDTGELPSPKRR